MKSFFVLSFSIFLFMRLNAQEEPKTPKQIPDSAGVYTFVETLPEFPGGNEKLINFIRRNITYPKYEKKNNIQGKVWVRFVIDVDGSVTDVLVPKPLSPGLDETAINVVKMLPRFKPGKQNGKPVKVYFNLPVQFQLNN